MSNMSKYAPRHTYLPQDPPSYTRWTQYHVNAQVLQDGICPATIMPVNLNTFQHKHGRECLISLCSNLSWWGNLIFFSIYLIIPVTLWPWGYSASNKNEYQKISLGLKHGWSVRLTSPSSVSQLSGKCQIDISQLFGPPWLVTAIALLPLLLYLVW
jgi:hypothetical protein